MIEIVTPRVVPDMPPAPLTTDPPQIFDDKGVAMAAGYPATIGGMNGSATDTNQNALAAKERAEQAQTAWSSVSSGVATINAALAAIQAGPVVSVMGRSGVVTGLVEAASGFLGTAAMSTAPLGQWASFNSAGAAGSDWPTSQGTAWWNVFTFGSATRKTQIAIQVFAGAEQSSMLVRSCHDTTWGLWQRFLGDFSLLEKAKYVTAPGSAYTANPREATLQYLDISAPLTVNVSTSRQPGDQMTMMFSFPTVSSIAFSSNVKAPVGGIRAGVAGNILTVPLIARPDGYWQAYDGGLHPW